MADLRAHHAENAATLQAVAQAVPSPPPAVVNPLLARGKLKKAPKPKAKAKKQDKQALQQTVEQVKRDELEVVSAGLEREQDVAGGEEAEVLDLADQLLAQLDTQLGEEAPLEQPSAPAAGLAVPTAPLRKSHSGSSSSSSGGAREALHDIKEGVKELFSSHSPRSESPPVGDQKISRQKARKVRSFRTLRSCSPLMLPLQRDHQRR